MSLGDGPPLMSFETSMEPYAQLVRSLLPRANALCLFDHAGKLLWSSVASTNPELFALVLQGIAQFDSQTGAARQQRAHQLGVRLHGGFEGHQRRTIA